METIDVNINTLRLLAFFISLLVTFCYARASRIMGITRNKEIYEARRSLRSPKVGFWIQLQQNKETNIRTRGNLDEFRFKGGVARE